MGVRCSCCLGCGDPVRARCRDRIRAAPPLWRQSAPIVVRWHGRGAKSLVLRRSVVRPPLVISQIASRLRLKRVADWVLEMNPFASRPLRTDSRQIQRANFSEIIRSRYAVLAVLLNMPGNSILGGGGGLAFWAGCRDHIASGRTSFSVMIAVAPSRSFSLQGKSDARARCPASPATHSTAAENRAVPTTSGRFRGCAAAWFHRWPIG